MEGLLESVASFTHGLSANGDTDLDAAFGDLIGDVLCGLQSGGAEAVDGGSTRSVRDAGCKRGGADNVGGFAVADLFCLVLVACTSELG